MKSNNFEASSVAFLTWLDALERMDTLMLEIRHVQETIASQLRLPEGQRPNLLYDVFEYEDYYLWGTYSEDFRFHPVNGAGTRAMAEAKGLADANDWSKVLDAIPLLSTGSYILATLWCPEFYPASLAPVEMDTIFDDHKVEYDKWFNARSLGDRKKEWRRCREVLTEQNLLSAIDERLYDVMRYLQLVKRDILRDKLILCRRALDAFESPNANIHRDPLVLFLIVRRAVLERLHKRLDAFADILSNVQETLNLSLERDPAPTVRRRRDQGIYTTDLADSCQHIARDIASYFAWNRGSRPQAHEAYLNLDKEIEFIIHRYTRIHTSTTRSEEAPEPPWRKLGANISERPLHRLRAGFVQSSFWMPERPDLRPIIAHEVAHLLIMHHYDNLDPLTLDGLNDPFSRLLRQISYTMEQFADRFRYFRFADDVRREFLIECAVDLVSVAVHGTAYIFAHFMELICAECEDLFAGHDIADNVLQLADENITFMRSNLPEWYLRVVVALNFSASLAQQNPTELKSLTDFVHKGAGALVQRVREQLFLWMDGDQKEDWVTWFEMTRVISELVGRSSFVSITRAWQVSREDEVDAWSRQPQVKIPFNRQLPTLPLEVRRHCLGSWLDRIVEKPRKLGQYLSRTADRHTISHDEIIRGFRKIYFGAHKERQTCENELFRHLIDVSWQCAILTAHDFFNDPDANLPSTVVGVDRKNWIAAAHEFNWLGRDLYHTGLEFVVWFERPPIGRLKAVNRWLTAISKDIDRLRQGHVTAEGATDVYSQEIATILNTFDGLRIAISTGTDGTDPAEIIDRMGKIWGGDSISQKDIAAVRSIGSFWICEHYPNRGTERYGEGATRQRWMHIFDFAAAEIMDETSRAIHRALVALTRIDENLSLAQQDDRRAFITLLNPDDHGPTEFNGLSRIIASWIRIAHYLNIRPEVRPIVGVGEKSDDEHPRRAVNWNLAFSQYLNVPTSGRKTVATRKNPTDTGSHVGSETNDIRELVPSRSFRIDRISLTYEHQPDDNQQSAESPDPDHTDGGVRREEPNRILVPFSRVYWTPWGPNGDEPFGDETNPLIQQVLTPSLLGRFDRIVLESAKHTARRRQYRAAIPFFRRQQIGIPFAAKVETTKRADGKGLTPVIGRLDSYGDRNPYPPPIRESDISTEGFLGKISARVPIATINILLSQRSARLTFVERLIAEGSVMQSYYESWRSPYSCFRPGEDVGLLTDGWGDIFLMLFCDVGGAFTGSFADYILRCKEIEDRLREVIKLRAALFDDPLVVRSETSYTAVPIDTALLNPRRYQSTMLVRFRSTLDGTPLADHFEQAIWYKLREYRLDRILRFMRISGRTDYAVVTLPVEHEAATGAYEELLQHPIHRVDTFLPYGVLFQSLRWILFREALGDMGAYIDSTSTLISDDVPHSGL